jgi:excinuclease ABC subunit C
MTVPAPITFTPESANLKQDIETAPAAPGIYLLQPHAGSPHLARSANLRRRFTRLFLGGADTPLARLRENVATVDYWPTTSRLESALLMHALARQNHPDDYLFRLKLHIPWFVGLTLADPFPRLIVTNRVARKETCLLGPFPSRSSAQIYEQQVCGLFQIRRCSEALKPSPDHPGCVYGEMNQCMRPCQCVVTREEYATEAQRVNEFLLTNGRSALSAMTAARDRAAEQTDFEHAAHVHKQIEKLRAAASARDDVIAHVYHLNGMALTRGLHAREFRLWPILNGFWQDCMRLELPEDDAQAKSLDQTLRELLTRITEKPVRQGRRSEDLAIFSRWYYSSWREGLWFPFRRVEDLNYRKLVRAISSMAKESGAHATC